MAQNQNWRDARECVECGDLFTPKSANQLCCGPVCSAVRTQRNSVRDRYLILERDGVKLMVDHVAPWSQTRDNSAGNLVTACTACNVAKSDKRIPDSAPLLREISRRNKAHGLLNEQVIDLGPRH